MSEGDTGIHLKWHFAVPIYDKTLPVFRERGPEIKEALLSMRARDRDAGELRSNRGGWHSAGNLQQTDDPVIKPLLHAILAVATACIRDFEKGRSQCEVAMIAAWANINETGDWNTPHMHLPADWAGVYYVDTGFAAGEEGPAGRPNAGEVMFFNPVPLGARWRRTNTANYRPRDGLMLLFPSYLLHMVAPHEGTKSRISLAFNLQVMREDPIY